MSILKGFESILEGFSTIFGIYTPGKTYQEIIEDLEIKVDLPKTTEEAWERDMEKMAQDWKNTYK